MEPAIVARVCMPDSMRAKKSPSLISPMGVIKLLNDGGKQAVVVFALTLVTTFAIGATLTGIVFILAEDKQP